MLKSTYLAPLTCVSPSTPIARTSAKFEGRRQAGNSALVSSDGHAHLCRLSYTRPRGMRVTKNTTHGEDGGFLTTLRSMKENDRTKFKRRLRR
jgi:hypothetical protein